MSTVEAELANYTTDIQSGTNSTTGQSLIVTLMFALAVTITLRQ